MVLVSHTHEFIFMKTHKTASTSVEMFFERFCVPQECEFMRPLPRLGARQVGVQAQLVGPCRQSTPTRGSPGLTGPQNELPAMQQAGKG